MGCDGGSIPKRDELVKTKKAAERPDAAAVAAAAWTQCALSKQPLAAPVAACALGRLFNKAALLEFLLDRSRFGDGDVVCGHITSIKDVVTLRLEPNPAFVAGDKRASVVLGGLSHQPAAPFCCPITHKEMSGKFRFVGIRSCGCVMSEQALKEVASEACLVCGKAFGAADVMLLNPTAAADVQAAEARLRELKAADAERRRLKKADKDARKAAQRAADGAGAGPSGSDDDQSAKKSKKRRAGDGAAAAEAQPAKKAAAAPAINMAMPDLSKVMTSLKPASDAVKSLYVKKGKDGKPLEQDGGFLVRGTFNRFAAGF